MTTMTAFILSVIISLVAQTDAQCITNAHIQASVDVLDEKISAMMGLSTMMAEFGKKIVDLEEEVKNLAGICSRSCSDGWSEFESSCYRLVEREMSWDDAMTNCKYLGGYLAEVESKQEDVFIYNLFKHLKGDSKGPWIGGLDRDVEGQWYWDHSKRPLGYTNWNKNEPNGRTKENCLHYRYRKARVWNDESCTTREMSICERPI